MRVPDQCLLDLRERGYLVFEGFLDADELAAAREAIWLHFPRPEEYFADPAAHAWLGTSQFAGIIGGPWRSWDLNRLTFHPDLLDLAERGELNKPGAIERIAIESYSEIVRWLGDDDSTTRKMITDILKMEEEHAEDLKSLLTPAEYDSVKRTTFKKAISEHQLVQAKLADMAVGIDAAALLVYRAAWQHDATEQSISREAAIAKLYSTEPPSTSLIRQCRFLAALASLGVRRWSACFGTPGHFEFSTEPAKFSSSL